MREFQDRKKYRKYMYSKAAIAGLAIVVLFFAHAVWGVYQKEKESAINRDRTQNELNKLTTHEHVLQADVNRLQTPQGVEEEIRNKYSVAKDGENVIIIVDNKSTDQPKSEEKPGFWARIVSFFTGH